VGGFAQAGAIAVDEATGDAYVLNLAGTGKGPGPFDDQRVVCRFDSEGQSQNLSATGESCLDGSGTGQAFGVEGFFQTGEIRTDVAVDNSGGSGGPGEGEQGRIYVSETEGPVHAFAPNGTWLWTLPNTTASSCGITVDGNGHLLVGNGERDTRVLEFDSEPLVGSPPHTPPEEIGSVPTTHASERPCRLAVDHDGKSLYVGLPSSPLHPSPGQPFIGGIDKYSQGAYDATLTTEPPFDITLDQSQQSGHVFVVGGANFKEYEPCEAAGCPGKETLGNPFGGDLVGRGRGIAYNPSLDWVYVSDYDSSTVKVFGPRASGTVPDVSCESVDGIGLHSATVHCTINPLGLPNGYHFEVKEGAGASWGAADSQPVSAQSIEPTDSSPHSVSLQITKYNDKNLKSNTAFQVRLAGTNAEPGKLLNSYSNLVEFKTLTPPQPSITNCSISAVGTGSAHLSCAIDTQAEETSWWVEKSTDPICGAGFLAGPQHVIPAEEAGPVSADGALEALLPSQHYCVRLSASGPGGTTVGPIKEIRTLAIPPSGAGAVFAAPRTDSTARINARINPNGEADVTYQFEVSEGEGLGWMPLPVRLLTLDTREPVVVAEELTGLEPDTNYRYRLALAENEAGPAGSLGAEKIFTTRSSAEVEEINSAGCPNKDVRQEQHTDAYLGSCRGIELVSEPDKGNQNALVASIGRSPMSADGDEVFWGVSGGAPKGPNGTFSSFLAKRIGEGSGWSSVATAPPAEEQLEGGELSYELSAASADFNSYVFNVKRSTGLSSPEAPSFVRVHRGRPQEILKRYELQPPNTAYESLLQVTEDAEHVVFPDNESLQLEDIGVPGAAEVLSLMPDGLESSCGLDVEGKSFGGNQQTRPGYLWIAATDASRVYFEAKPNKAAPNSEECEKSAPFGLYVRSREAGETILVDPGVAGHDPEFIRATPDGRHAYFLSYSPLEPADANVDADIYRWNEESRSSTCLTCVVPDAAVSGHVVVSDDFSHVYFESTRQLVSGQGNAGDVNLYSLSGGQLRFVGDVGASVLHQGARPALSVDGNVLLFGALARPGLTADAMAPQCTEPISQKPEACNQLYRYDDRDGSLECISCRHDGMTTHSFGAPSGSSGVHLQLSADGTTAAFVTQQSLLPADVNQNTDIYEWRGGGRALITDGVSDFQTEATAPRVLAVSANGGDILFGLVPPRGSLTGFEHDKLLDLYDARIGGGFDPPSAPAHCLEDSCQGPLQPAPALEQGASLRPNRGNVPPPRKKRPCAGKRGKAKRHCSSGRRKHRRVHKTDADHGRRTR
jgi:hypothetical protein